MPRQTVTEQRTGPRYLASLLVRAEWETEEGKHIVAEGTTENVGPDGALVHLQRELPDVGSRVRLAVLSDEGQKLQVEDESRGEPIGIGEATDIGQGGLRVRYLPKNTVVQAGDRLGLLLIDEEEALSLRAEVVHHGTSDSFGVEFRDLSAREQYAIDHLLQRLHT